MPGPSPTSDLPTSELIRALIHAHRETQADHRAALAADHDHDLDTASRRLAAIHTRLRALGHADYGYKPTTSLTTPLDLAELAVPAPTRAPPAISPGGPTPCCPRSPTPRRRAPQPGPPISATPP